MALSFRGWVWVLGFLSACGGGVVLEGSGSAGGSGAGGGGAGGEGGAPGQSACEQACEAHAVVCDDKAACLTLCLEIASYQGICVPELEAELQCLTAHPPTDPKDCKGGPPPECDPQLAARVSCIYPAGPCDDLGECAIGSSGGPDVACKITCGGSVYTQDCDHPGLGAEPPLACVCQIDGKQVGTCQADSFFGIGNMGCCSGFFAKSK
jgi:hypothetical protein